MDAEHYTVELLEALAGHPRFHFLCAAPNTSRIRRALQALDYRRQWPGYGLGTGSFQLDESDCSLVLIGQRTGERPEEYTYKGFVSDQPPSSPQALEWLTQRYPQRWSIESFFNFEQALGWKRAATLNLNIRYGKMSLALLGQAVLCQVRQKLPGPYRRWSAEHLARRLFTQLDGDLRVEDDVLIVTIYNAPPELNLPAHYTQLPQRLAREGVDPRMPWLYDLKLDFKFK